MALQAKLTQAELLDRYRSLHESGRILMNGVRTTVVPEEMWDGRCFVRRLMNRALHAYHDNPGRVLDFGCGKANYANRLWAAGVNRRHWTFYDPGYTKFSTPPTGKFDFVVCADVMEHILDYEEALEYLADRVTTNAKLFFSISTVPDKRAFIQDGVNFHVTQKSAKEWCKLLSKHFRNRYIYLDVDGKTMETGGAVL